MALMLKHWLCVELGWIWSGTANATVTLNIKTGDFIIADRIGFVD